MRKNHSLLDERLLRNIIDLMGRVNKCNVLWFGGEMGFSHWASQLTEVQVTESSSGGFQVRKDPAFLKRDIVGQEVVRKFSSQVPGIVHHFFHTFFSFSNRQALKDVLL